jgi:hypothetical protein
MTRPVLRPLPLDTALAWLAACKLPSGRPCIAVTLSVGQWTTLHHVFYDQGAVLLELDDDEQPVAAYFSPQ